MILLCKLAAAVFVAAVLMLILKKDQPAFAFLVSVCTAAGLLAVVVRQQQPLLDWLRTLDGYFQRAEPGGSAARSRHCAGRAVCRRYLQGGRADRRGRCGRALRPCAGAFAGSAAAANAARLLCGLLAVMLPGSGAAALPLRTSFPRPRRSSSTKVAFLPPMPPGGR